MKTVMFACEQCINKCIVQMRLSVNDDGLPEQCVFSGGDVVSKWEKVQQEHISSISDRH